MDVSPGPVDVSVLYEQDKHVSAAVWEGQERGALRCHEHTSKLGEWSLTPRQIELVEKSGFGFLRKIPAISLDNPLISALVERWRKETNTFHFTVGEMTVTLQDVALLLGLAIDGKPVIGITHTTCAAVCEKLLGKAPDSNYASGGMVKLSWLKEYFSHCTKDSPKEEVEQCTRAYLLYLVGSTIFSTTTGNKVPVMYLPLFDNFEECGTYAWGAAALAFLYRALGNACVKSQSTICGCLTLLQCWSYFHLDIGRPKLNRDPIHDSFPFVLKWKGKQSGPTTNRDVVFYRKALDSLKPTDVNWLPYKDMDTTGIPEPIKDTLILGRSKTMLICFDKAERHLPDRCLRQYGMFQPVPEDVPRWVRKSRGVDGGVDLSGKMESELNEWASRHLHIVEGSDAIMDDETVYMEWYLRITRKVVGRPISLSTEFQRTVILSNLIYLLIAGLREIAYLADSFSTKGLDGQQFESISRIRYIAQDCLRDQSGNPASTAVAVDITPVELGKRIRGKERVRRKGSGKRRRKDELVEEYQEGSEDEPSQFYGGVVEVDPLHGIPTVSAMDVDAHILSHFSGDGENAEILYDGQLFDGTSDFKEPRNTDGLTNHVINHKLDIPTEKLNDEVSDSQLFDGATESDNLNNEIHDAVDEVGVPKLINACIVSSDEQLPHATAGMTSVSKPLDVSNEMELADTITAVNDGEKLAAEETSLDTESQLPNAAEVAGELQLTRDAEILHPSHVKTEMDHSQASDPTNGGEKVENSHIYECPHLSDSKGENGSQNNTSEDEKDSQRPDEDRNESTLPHIADVIDPATTKSAADDVPTSSPGTVAT
ncbi:unnamed protein product [Linum tenue]|uniref:Aminotransferase-like plant mobile domain-containing protein n=1 Tax=Linum tenue TaxID=586396 RepID=A0AAV0HF11_9ROSI|nr:unnamed protein product [Linum tenue]